VRTAEDCGSGTRPSADAVTLRVGEACGVISAVASCASAVPPAATGCGLGRAMFGGRRVFNLTITNVRASETPLFALGAPLREVLPYVPPFA